MERYVREHEEAWLRRLTSVWSSLEKEKKRKGKHASSNIVNAAPRQFGRGMITILLAILYSTTNRTCRRGDLCITRTLSKKKVKGTTRDHAKRPARRQKFTTSFPIACCQSSQQEQRTLDAAAAAAHVFPGVTQTPAS